MNANQQLLLQLQETIDKFKHEYTDMQKELTYQLTYISRQLNMETKIHIKYKNASRLSPEQLASIEEFIELKCSKSGDALSPVLYKAYAKPIAMQRIEPMSQNRFIDGLKQLGYRLIKQSPQSRWQGLSLRNP